VFRFHHGVLRRKQLWQIEHPQSPFVRITEVGFGISQVVPALTLLTYVPKYSGAAGNPSASGNTVCAGRCSQ
jgi:predicted ATPase